MPTPSSRNRGFTLIEVLVSSVLFVVGLAGILGAFHMVRTELIHQKRMTTAITLTEGKMEELLLRFSTDPSLSTPVPSFADENGLPVPPASKVFGTTWTVAPGSITGVRKINVITTWSESGGPKSVQFTTERS
jgi:prepilin-type N-terminal cleavage/methylation domain-containing protein